MSAGAPIASPAPVGIETDWGIRTLGIKLFLDVFSVRTFEAGWPGLRLGFWAAGERGVGFGCLRL